MVLEPKDQLITENDLTLKPSVENNLSLTIYRVALVGMFVQWPSSDGTDSSTDQ